MSIFKFVGSAAFLIMYDTFYEYLKYLKKSFWIKYIYILLKYTTKILLNKFYIYYYGITKFKKYKYEIRNTIDKFQEGIYDEYGIQRNIL